VVHANGTFASGSFVPTPPGEYRWLTAYSGDAENEAAGGECGGAGQSVTVGLATPGLTTAATPSVPVGAEVADTATLTGGYNPTGTITFELFAPGDSSCSGVPVFTSIAPLGEGGATASAPFAPLAAGSYPWRASYSGDANNEPAVGPCGAAGETSTVTAPSSGPGPAPTPRPAPEPEADLRVRLAGPQHAVVGKPFTYRVTVANSGAASARSIELSNRLSGAGTQIEHVRGAAYKSDDPVTCKFSVLQPGKQVRVEIRVVAKAAGRLTLTSALRSPTPDADRTIVIARSGRREPANRRAQSKSISRLVARFL
jgi:hypothetical protein